MAGEATTFGLAQGRGIVQGAGGTPSLLLNPTVAFLGDSRIDYGVSYTANTSHFSNVNGFVGWFLALMGGSVYMPMNGERGVVGDTLQQMLARFDTEIAPLAPALVLVEGGVNNLKGTSDSLAVMTAALDAIIAKCRALPSKPLMLILNEPASSTITGGRETVRVGYNAYQAGLVASDLIPVDVTSVNMADPTVSADQVHLLPKGCLQSASLAVAAIQARISPLATYPSARNIGLTNNVFAGAGPNPTGWSLFDNSGGATIVTALVVKNGRVYWEASITGTYTGSGKLVNLTQQSATTPSGLVSGDLIEGFAYVEVDAGAVSLDSVYFHVQAGNQSSRAMQSTADLPFPSDIDRSFLLRTPPINFNSGTGYASRLSIILPTAASATAVNVKARFALPVLAKV